MLVKLKKSLCGRIMEPALLNYWINTGALYSKNCLFKQFNAVSCLLLLYKELMTDVTNCRAGANISTRFHSAITECFISCCFHNTEILVIERKVCSTYLHIALNTMHRQHHLYVRSNYTTAQVFCTSFSCNVKEQCKRM